MDDFQIKGDSTLPRWVSIILGILLTPITLVCVIGCLALLTTPNVPPTFLTISLSSVFLAGSLWMLSLSLRLIFISPKKAKGLMSPLGLKVVALIFALIPIISLITGTFWEKPLLYSVMSVLYFGIVVRLWGLANSRGKNA